MNEIYVTWGATDNPKTTPKKIESLNGLRTQENCINMNFFSTVEV